MRSILIRLNQPNFEYDVYTLIKAFYPEADIRTLHTEASRPEDILPFSDCVTDMPADSRNSMQDTGNLPDAGDCVFDVEICTDGIKVTYEDPSADPDRVFLSETMCLPENADRKTVKNSMKQMLYRILRETAGKDLPWGDLTGIRPVKIPMRMLEEGRTEEEITSFLQDTYFVSSRKAALAIDTAKTEKALLEGLHTENGWSLYVGIPFCTSICLYCSFGSHPLARFQKQTDPYLDALTEELSFIRDQMRGRPLDTVYIGGGTPTALDEIQLERLLRTVDAFFLQENRCREFTVEAGRPDTITAGKLSVMRSFPVTRISINPQTMNQQTLDRIGRKHTVEDICRTFAEARNTGFDNINMDLIVGLPGEGEPEVRRTLDEVMKLSPDSLTVHSLALKRATRLNLFRDEYVPVSFENSDRIMDSAADAARSMGMHPYYLYRQKNMAGNFENVGYAVPGKECLYNILIMEEKQTIIAAGSGASTKFVFDGGNRIERVENVKDLGQYISRLPEMLERKKRGMDAYLPPLSGNASAGHPAGKHGL